MHVRNRLSRIVRLTADLSISSSRPAFPIDCNKPAVVLPRTFRPFDSDKMEPGVDSTEAIAEFYRELNNQGLSVPKLGRFLPDHAKVPPIENISRRR